MNACIELGIIALLAIILLGRPKILCNCIMGLLRMRMDALHYALLAVLVLLVFYAASTYGLFKEAETLKQTSMINMRNFKF